jgi:hypothetical protein
MSAAEQYDWHRAFLRRHPVTRRAVLLGSAAAAAMAAAGCAPSSRSTSGGSGLTVGGRHVTFGADAATQLRFAGQLSRRPDANVTVYLDHGPTPALGATVRAQVRNLLSQVPQTDGGILAAEQFYVHAGVDGLPAAGRHFYRWRTSDGYVGEIASAATAAAAGPAGGVAPFRFTMMGDQGTDQPPAKPGGLVVGAYDDRYYAPDNDPTVSHAGNIMKQIVAAKPAFHLLAGDIAYADPTGHGKPDKFVPGPQTVKPPAGFDKFNPYVWDSYFQTIESSAANTPWLFATGNHDIETLYSPHGYGGHAARLEFPGNGPAGCPSVYSFRYGNVAVLSLDANDVTYEYRANTGYSGGAQNGWVERTLAGYRADPTVDFIVCFFHQCAYSTAKDHASDGGVREAWTPLFDRYHVDLVLSGHNHIFERTDPMRAGAPTRVAEDNAIVYPATDGTVYYTVGGGGRPRYEFQPGVRTTFRGAALAMAETAVPNSYVWTPDGGKTPEAVAWSRVRFDNYAFLRVDVRPGTLVSEMDVTAVDEYGREFDKLTFRRSR